VQRRPWLLELGGIRATNGMETSGIRHVVIIVHGIRDYGPWQSAMVRGLGSDSTHVIPIKIGRFSSLYFLCPIPLHFLRRRKVEKEILAALNQFKNARVSIIAHSFGTYLISRILRRGKLPERIHRIIFCGAVVRDDFPWDKVHLRIDGPPTRNYVLNECGNADPWPAVAEAASWRYGRTGTHGAGTGFVTDRYHEGNHSVFLTEEFARKWWLPFLERGTIVPSPANAAEKVCPALLKACSPPYLYFVRIAVLGAYAAIVSLLAMGLVWVWGMLAPYIIPRQLDTMELASAISSSEDWSFSNAMRQWIWELAEVPVHVHGTIDRVTGNVIHVTLDRSEGLDFVTAEIGVREPSVVASAKANEGRRFCMRGRLESLDDEEIQLNSVPGLVVYETVNSISSLKKLPNGIVATVQGSIESISYENGVLRCEIIEADDASQRLIAKMHEGEDIDHLSKGDTIFLQGRYSKTIGTPYLNNARRLSKSGDTEYHAAEIHKDR
jgi:pimeloyl-ACP methyl ester carboxylesterase